MKKKLIFAIVAVVLSVTLGVGIYQSDAAKSNPELTFDDIEQIVSAQYPGTISEIELEKKYDKVVYDVDVITDDKKYDIKLDANTGEIVKIEEKQRKQDVNVTETQDNQKDAKQPKLENREPELIIDMKEAIDIALKEYPGKVKEAELDEEDGRLIYEIEIKANGEEVDIDIDAKTGEILIIEIDD